MTGEQLIQIAKKNLKTMLLLGALLGALSFLFLVVSQKSFRAKTDVLIVQNQPGNVDFFTLSKSSEYISNVLVEAVYSERFLDKIKDTGLVNSEFVSPEKTKKLKSWKKIIRIRKNSASGMVNMDVYGDSQKQAAEISAAVISVLENQSSEFLGAGQSVEIRRLSGPIIESNPSMTQILLAAMGGMAAGMILVFLGAVFSAMAKKEELPSFSVSGNELVFTDEKAKEENRVMSFQEAAPMIENEDYFSPNSDYWKKRINSLR